MQKKIDVEALRKWFLENARDFPWRQDRTPYKVWVSEMMLQQTQANVVVPYFIRWMEQFPTIEALAQADLDTVLKAWEGLGYYSRARFLHQGAQHILDNHQGIFPSDLVDLKQIKGIGTYTCGAILSLAFGKKIAAVDGNVIRVLARYYGISDDISKPTTVKMITSFAQEILPDRSPGEINEGLIELGATLCKKQKPQCGKCPIKKSCKAYLHGTVDKIPFKSSKVKITQISRTVLLIKFDNYYLVRRVKSGEIMSDLYEFPYFESAESLDLVREIKRSFKLQVEPQQCFPEVKQSFTRYRATLFPQLFIAKQKPVISDYEWLTTSEMAQKAFSSGHRKILEGLRDSRGLEDNREWT